MPSPLSPADFRCLRRRRHREARGRQTWMTPPRDAAAGLGRKDGRPVVGPCGAPQ